MSPTFLVPQGFEYETVRQGCLSTSIKPIPIPLGRSSAAYVESLAIDRGFVILWGLCGGLVADLPLGTIVIVEKCTYRDETFHFDPSLVKILAQELQSPLVNCYTSDRVLHQKSQKNLVAQATNCAVVDMEGYFVLQALKEREIPMGMVRIVSDDIFHDLPNLSLCFNDSGALNYFSLAWQLLQNPLGAFHLIRGSLIGLQQLRSAVSHLCTNPSILGLESVYTKY